MGVKIEEKKKQGSSDNVAFVPGISDLFSFFSVFTF
jgi:hypothetical protein